MMSLSYETDKFQEVLTKQEFDAVQYLNDVLPTITLSSQAAASKQNRLGLLQSSLSETQSLITRLNTYNIRKSTELTFITDEILRSGNRLAYEVEVLRSDAHHFHDLLSDTLQDDMQVFVRDEFNTTNGHDQTGDDAIPVAEDVKGTTDPDFIQELRLLGLVKTRLENVISIFGEALKWPIPPSDISVASSLISVSAPELGVANSAEDDKARAIFKQYRDEIVELLQSGQGQQATLDAADMRVQQWRDLAGLWKGTIEEKARARLVDSLEKLVEEKRRALRKSQNRRTEQESARSSAQPSRTGTPGISGGGSFFGGLRKLRDEIYLE